MLPSTNANGISTGSSETQANASSAISTGATKQSRRFLTAEGAATLARCTSATSRVTSASPNPACPTRPPERRNQQAPSARCPRATPPSSSRVSSLYRTTACSLIRRNYKRKKEKQRRASKRLQPRLSSQHPRPRQTRKPLPRLGPRLQRPAKRPHNQKKPQPWLRPRPPRL